MLYVDLIISHMHAMYLGTIKKRPGRCGGLGLKMVRENWVNEFRLEAGAVTSQCMHPYVRRCSCVPAPRTLYGEMGARGARNFPLN